MLTNYHKWFVVHSFNRRHLFYEDRGPETKLYAICTDEGEQWTFGLAENPNLRRSDLQVGSPMPLILYAAVPAKSSLEEHVHAVLAEHRLVGEWFAAAPETLVIAECLIGIEQACHDVELSENILPQFQETLFWLFSRVEGYMEDLEEELLANIGKNVEGDASTFEQ
jgi:hypothetical protein